MKRLDLIIDALKLAYELVPRSVMYPASHHHMQIAQALAEARELRELKPVAMTDKKYPFECYLFDGVELPAETLLYALGDEK